MEKITEVEYAGRVFRGTKQEWKDRLYREYEIWVQRHNPAPAQWASAYEKMVEAREKNKRAQSSQD